MFITTPGRRCPPGCELSGRNARPGDVILVSGTLAITVWRSWRSGKSLGFESPIMSDTAALHGLIAAMRASGAEIHVLRDPDTRRAGDNPQ